LEALNEVSGYLFNTPDKQRLIASIDPENLPSVKLFETLGFTSDNPLHDGNLPDDLPGADLVSSLYRSGLNSSITLAETQKG
jgi:RimJ/RimL family protein N-acetyltransferase